MPVKEEPAETEQEEEEQEDGDTPQEGHAIIMFMNLNEKFRFFRASMTSMGGYSLLFDEVQKSLRWQSQRSDKLSKKVKRIARWAERGGRIEVFVRSSGFSEFVRFGDCLVQPRGRGDFPSQGR